MSPLTVECLQCGHPRDHSRRSGAGECPRCGYVGWAPAGDLDERTRRLVRDIPLERRRLIRAI